MGDLRQLECLLAVVEEGSFTRAAARLCMVQSIRPCPPAASPPPAGAASRGDRGDRSFCRYGDGCGVGTPRGSGGETLPSAA
ncbi:LysR family transcriptional regulator [Blastococcus brunescens]|uniref:LysR family transcriptional regulator n=1 Tax=Blastococcus brunescens TaxID=1564165 RepID=UPI003BEF2549